MTQPADLLVTGRVATLAGDDGFGWRPALAIKDGLVIAADKGMRARERWDLGDDVVVMPGITDAHLHLMTLIVAERHIDLTGAGLEETLARIGERHRELVAAGDDDGWLLGHGWSLHALARWPTTADLESVAPNRPIALWAHDHHTRWVSRRAMHLAGIESDTAAPSGSSLIRRGPDGVATGILHEGAAVLVDHAIPKPAADELAGGLQRIAAQLAALGVTGAHDPAELTADTDMARGPLFYRALAEQGRLPLRVHASVRAQHLHLAIELGLTSGQGVDASSDDPGLDRATAHYRMGWLKLFADGSLGSRSAALLEPYTDAASNPPTGGPTGLVVTDTEELTELLSRAARHGIVGQVHAIGDAAVRSVLDVFEALGPPSGERLMRRIEHAQLVDPADMPRFGALGVAASLQPVHLRSDAEQARLGWGSRSDNTFPLRALVDGGALIPMGTDAPVEPPDPWPGITVAVVRRDPFRPDDHPTNAAQSIDLARAVRAACLDPALVAGEPLLGRLSPGYRADLLVVPAAPFRERFDPAAFASIRPLATLIDGQIVYRSNGFGG